LGKKLTAEERETVFVTCDADSSWEVYTFDEDLKDRLVGYCRRFPRQCEFIREEKDAGSVTYRLSKDRFRIALSLK